MINSKMLAVVYDNYNWEIEFLVRQNDAPYVAKILDELRNVEDRTFLDVYTRLDKEGIEYFRINNCIKLDF